MLNEVNGKLLTNPQVEVPQWIDCIKFKKPVERQMNIEFDADTINRKHVIAERDTDLGNVRDLKLSFNDKQLQVFAMNDMAKFLRKYRYDATASVNNGEVNITVMFENNPLEYNFKYVENNGKVVANKIFQTKIANIVNEYPFSLAGIEDSFEDSKNIDLKESTKVKKANVDFSVMTRYEILKRCNNRLSEARDIIEHHLKEGNIVAVGSNEYASTYDMNMLFPDKREKFAGEEHHTLEFVDNKVATASYENKSANRLALESCAIINRVFDITEIVNAKREGDRLCVTASIQHNNIRNKYSFVFDIANEKVGKLNCIEDADNSYSVAQLLNKFGEEDKKIVAYLNGKDSHVAGGYVYSAKMIYAKLGKYISKENIDKMLASWIDENKATKISTASYASKFSLNELVQGTEFLSAEEIANIRKAQIVFGNDEKFYIYETKDNDTRTNEAVEKINSYKDTVVASVSKYFKNFDVKMLGKDSFVIEFKTDTNKKRVVSASINNGNILCKVGQKHVALKNLSDMFKRSALLNAYTNDVDEDMSKEHKMVISKRQFVNELKDYLTEVQIDELIEDLVAKKKLVRVSSTTFASNLQFKDLLNEYTDTVDTGIKQANLEKANKTTLKELVRHYIADGDTRSAVALNNAEAKFAQIYNRIGKYLSNFDLKMIDGNHVVIAFKSEDNKKRNIVATVGEKIVCQVGGKDIEIKDLTKRFKNSKLLSAYLAENNGDNHHKVIISKRMFKERLADVLANEDIETMVDDFEENGLIQKIATDMYASEMSFEDLLRMSDLDIQEGLREENLAKKNKSAGKELEADYVDDNDTRQVEKQLTQSEFKAQFNKALPKYMACANFSNIRIADGIAHCDAEIFNKENGLSVNASFDMKVDNGNIRTESISNVDELFKLSTINKTYNQYNMDKKENHAILINKKELINKLDKLADVEEVEQALDMWEKTSKIARIDNNLYASQYSVDQLLSMSNIKSYDEETIASKYQKAKINTEIVPKEYHVQDSDSKMLSNVEDGKSLAHLNEVKASCRELICDLVAEYKITAKKAEVLKEAVNSAQDYVALDNVNKQIERYTH